MSRWQWLKTNGQWYWWSYIPVIGWASWIHAGVRARQPEFFVLAVLYAIPCIPWMIFCQPEKTTTHPVLLNIAAVLMGTDWIAVIAHTHLRMLHVNTLIAKAESAVGAPVLPETTPQQAQVASPPAADWKCRIAGREHGPFTTARLRHLAESGRLKPTDSVYRTGAKDWVPAERVKGLFPDSAAAFSPSSCGTGVPKSASDVAPSAPVDLNNASEEAIAALPGIGPILAKKAVGVRQSSGSFSTVEAFGAAIGLKPHVVERIRPLVSFGARKAEEPTSPKARVVDY